tara:strand:+ start:162 stop:371 length:210 start_codon:yes stop_codon:yes gene_type:complete
MIEKKKFYLSNLQKFVVNYPQEKLEGELYKYRCLHCKIGTLEIKGKIENHAEDCFFRLEFEKIYGHIKE